MPQIASIGIVFTHPYIHGDFIMIAASIFLLLLLTLLTTLTRRPRLTLVMFIVSWVAVLLLFLHHSTDSLNLSF